jgi:hypothetical protein
LLLKQVGLVLLLRTVLLKEVVLLDMFLVHLDIIILLYVHGVLLV